MRLLVLLLVMVAPSLALAGTSERYGMGGRFARFDPVVAEHNRTGELFRIQGHCQSACTLFLAIRTVCVERSARLLFHGGVRGNMSAANTAHMMAAYRPRLRQYLAANHYMDTPAFHAIAGADIIDRFGYKECPRR